MRMHEWTADMIRFMRDASERTAFYEELANEIVATLGGAAAVSRMTLCDAGCGLGYLSLALAKRCKRVVAADVSAPALAVLRENIERQDVDNVEPRLLDIRQLPEDEHFDAMIFCLFGRLPDVVQIARGHCGRIVVVKKNWTSRRFSMRRDVEERDTLHEALQTLEKLGLSCETHVATLALHQPFRSFEDAMLFFRIYADQPDEVDEAIVQSRLVTGDSAAFPWLLPVPRELGILFVAFPDVSHDST